MFFWNEYGQQRRLLVAKTYDLTRAYRQILLRKDQLKFACFCAYKYELDEVELYSFTLPFGAYSFLHLAQMLKCIARRDAKLIMIAFYDDCVFASAGQLQESAENSVDLTFSVGGTLGNIMVARRRIFLFGSALGVAFSPKV